MYSTNETQITTEKLKCTNSIVGKWCQIIYFNFGCHSYLTKITSMGSTNQVVDRLSTLSGYVLSFRLQETIFLANASTHNMTFLPFYCSSKKSQPIVPSFISYWDFCMRSWDSLHLYPTLQETKCPRQVNETLKQSVPTFSAFKPAPSTHLPAVLPCSVLLPPLFQSPALLRVTLCLSHHHHLSCSEGDISCLEPKNE